MLPIERHEVFIIAHIIGTAIGVGGASATYFLFLRFVTDATVDRKEVEVLHLMSFLVNAGLAVLVASGIAFIVVDDSYLSNPKVLAKLTVVLIIFINAQVMHRKVFPILEALLDRPLTDVEYIRGKVPLLFTTGAISGVSWYTAVALGAWRSLNFDYPYAAVFGGYLVVLLVAVGVSNLIGHAAVLRFRARSESSAG